MRPFIGTAGWNVPAQHAAGFPGSGTHLERYAAQLNAVEINSSFYRPHRRQTYERWACSTPENFRFAVKMPKAITHERKLLACEAELDCFLAQVGGLGEKLGVLLVQLPPSLAIDTTVAKNFFAHLKTHTDTAIACEPRHPSWFSGSANALLVAHKIARVAADPPPCPGADEPAGSQHLIYYRLHGSPRIYYSNYETAALVTLRRRLDEHCQRGVPAWCIFDNTASGAALGNALAVAGSFGGDLASVLR